MILPVASLALGLLAGALANWAADTLPYGVEEAGAARAVPCRSPWHFLTLPWYFVSAGACPACGARRPWRAPGLEAAMALLFLAAGLRFAGEPLALAIAWLYIAFLLAVLVIDLEHRLVLNVMLAPAALIALALSLRAGLPGLAGALVGGAAGLVMFILFALISRGHMGGGDVKLAVVIGLMLGFPAALTALVAGVVLGGVAAILLLVTRRAGPKSYMAYAPYMSLGALAVLLRLIGQ